MFWVISVYFNTRNTLPKSGTFLLGHPVYALISRRSNSVTLSLPCAGLEGVLGSGSVATTVNSRLDGGELPHTSVTLLLGKRVSGTV